jgi:cyclophilin family peptidyl-prolyl cis-trans isomerase
MYYTAKTVTDRVYVSYDSGEEGEMASREYKYNSATSLFYINLKTTETTSTEYCTFATLKKGSVSDLEDLQAAIAEYIEDNYTEESEFTNSKSVNVDYNDILLEDYSKNVSYNIPKTPIVIESIKVSKY